MNFQHLFFTGDEVDTDHFDFNDIFKDLTELREFCVVYGVRDCGMNFEWNLFQFTARDCQQLSKCIATTKHLTSFTITRSKVRLACNLHCLFVISAVHFAPYSTGHSSVMLI